MSDAPLLSVKGFGTFQHYRDRNPPWIKLYGTLLSDVAFLEMPESAQAQLIKLWLLASQFGHPLPNNPKLLAGKIGTTGKFHLATLIAYGFLIPCDSASTPLADSLAERLQDARGPAPAPARSRERGELELEREIDLQPTNQPPPSDPARELLLDRLSEPRCRASVAVFLDRVPPSDVPAFWSCEVNGWLDGLNTPGGRGATEAHVAAALEEFNRKVDPSYDPLYVRGFLKRTMIGQAPRAERRNGGPVNAGAQMVANILGGSK